MEKMTSNDQNNIPLLNGLVLAGGKSVRMGTAKDQLNWHGKEQRYFAADLLAPFCEEVFISCRQDQLDHFDTGYNTLTDTFLNMGLLEAFSLPFVLKEIKHGWLLHVICLCWIRSH